MAMPLKCLSLMARERVRGHSDQGMGKVGGVMRMGAMRHDNIKNK